MSSRALSIGISPQERTRLCKVASEEICLQAAHYVRRAAQVSDEDAAAEPYVRAVYICQASTVIADRVSVASGEECGSYLRGLLRACVADSAANAIVPCWLTVMLEDTCIVQHAVFAVAAGSLEPQSWTSTIAVQPDGSPFQPGDVRWSTSAQPVPVRAAPNGHVSTPPDAALAAGGAAVAPRDVSAAAQKQVVPPPSAAAPTTSAARAQPQQQQQQPAREAAQEATATVRSMATTPCVHSTRTFAKAIAMANPPLAQQQQSDPRTAEQPRGAQESSQHQSYPCSSSQSATAPKRSTTCPHPVPSVYDRMEKYRMDAVPDITQRRRPTREDVQRPQEETEGDPSWQRDDVEAAPSSQRPPQQSNQPSRNPDGLIVYDSPQADVVAPSNGRQWGDLAYRTRYSPRREELWDIANAVMTHNYAPAMLDSGEEPAYIEDRYYDEAEAA